MKTNEFKNFLAGLSNEQTRHNFESMGWAFMQCTEKQITKIIDVYKEKGLCTISDNRIYFGMNNAVSFPIADYNRVKGVN